jgi:hypothetical protein
VARRRSEQSSAQGRHDRGFSKVRKICTRTDSDAKLIYSREGVHRSDADPRDHITCVVANKDGSVTTDHFAIQKKTDKSDDKNTQKSPDKDAEN